MNAFFYQLCECYVWPYPLSMGNNDPGTCARCGTVPEGYYYDPAKALAAFIEVHGKEPEPIGEVAWWQRTN